MIQKFFDVELSVDPLDPPLSLPPSLDPPLEVGPLAIPAYKVSCLRPLVL